MCTAAHGCGRHCNPACRPGAARSGAGGTRAAGAASPGGRFASPPLLRCIYNPELACERELALAGLLFPHEGSSPEVCGHQSKLTGHCFFSMTAAAPPDGDRCPASKALLCTDLLLREKRSKTGALGAACTAPARFAQIPREGNNSGTQSSYTWENALCGSPPLSQSCFLPASLSLEHLQSSKQPLNLIIERWIDWFLQELLLQGDGDRLKSVDGRQL